MLKLLLAFHFDPELFFRLRNANYNFWHSSFMFSGELQDIINKYPTIQEEIYELCDVWDAIDKVGPWP